MPLMGKSPQRLKPTSAKAMESGAPGPSAASATKSSQGAEAPATAMSAVDVPATPVAAGVATRSSTAASAAQRDSVLAALHKRIALLENSLLEANGAIKEHEARIEGLATNAPNNSSMSSNSNTPGVPGLQQATATTTQPQGEGLPRSEEVNRIVPLARPTVSRCSPPLFATSTSAANVQVFTVNAAATTNSMNGSATPASDTTAASLNSLAVPNFVSVNPATAPFPSVLRKVQDLPEFSGKPEDWTVFYTAFTESTVVYGYTNFENNQRLQKCLKGEARETVKSLLIHPENVSDVIEHLKFRFGRPEQLIRSQLSQVREIAPVAEHNMVKLIPFATKVNNICVFLQSSARGELHLANPTLLDELVSKLPMSKRIEWASYAASVQPYATVKHFSDWLFKLANVISTVYVEERTRDAKSRVVLHTVEPPYSPKCPICQGQHKVPGCARFLELSVPRRWEEAKRYRLCFACLNLGHGTRDCQRRKPCAMEGCRRMHNKLLHEAVDNNNLRKRSTTTQTHSSSNSVGNAPSQRRSAVAQSSSYSQQPTQITESTMLGCSSTDTKLLFRILPVTLYANQKRIDTYALLDEGSSITMIDRALIRDLGVQGREQCLNIQWFGGRAAQEPTTVVDLLISGTGMAKRHKLRNVYAVSNLQLPVQSLSEDDLYPEVKYIRQLPMQPYYQVKPKLLIGLDHCHLGLPSTTMKIKKSGPFVANTELGWVVFGPTSTTLPLSPSCLFVDCHADQSLHNMVADYFNIESFGVRAAPLIESEADARARTILKSTTCRVDGRFKTGLLWKRDNVRLPDSYSMALKRLTNVEKRMSRDAAFAVEYKRIMDSYVMKKYARKLLPAEAAVFMPTTWYLPHFAVANPNKPGKLRMVFDAAAEVSGVSLNSQLLKGPQEYRSLPSILFHFREGAVAVCGDIKEMYHQVLIRQEDRCAQRFLWRGGDATKQPDVYEMCVMTFGAACSPCAANYVKTINALEHQSEDGTNTRAVKAILEHHYVDDFVDSFSSEEEAIAVSQQVRAIHIGAGFELRNFTSNSSNVVAALGGTDVTRSIAKKEGVLVERVLGLFWRPSSDNFGFNLKFHNVDIAVVNGDRCPTKRELLSIVMSIFDPLGLLCNFVIGAKLIMREAWKYDICWDEPLPDYVNAMWEKWRKQLPAVAKYAIPRFYFRHGAPHKLQLHIFVDASEDAFAAVAYWRSQNLLGEIEVSFVCAKSKCAPMKAITVPRLELQAAVLGTRLMHCLCNEHSAKIEDCVLWSDSKTVIKWIQSEHRRYKPFVQHRVAEILASTSTKYWRWLPTTQNVADEATRMKECIDFSSAARWSCGPQFLQQEEEFWPSEDGITSSRDEPDEEIRPKYALVIMSCNLFDFNRFSSFNRLVRATAWILRFIDNCRCLAKLDRCYGLTAEEVESGKRLLCRVVQREMYAAELQSIEDGHDIARDSTLLQLSPYLAELGILRVKGRIDAASWLPMSTRHPIILPPNHTFTKLLVLHYHNNMCHQNSEATICSIRRKYWVPRLRTLLRSVIASCAVCRLNKAAPVAPLMGPLPTDRLTPYVRPFSYTGLDYFGPIFVTVRRSTEKRWVALFTCLTVRAVHLELVHDLSTDSCIIAIRNFINRRCVPIRIRSDNGKNFVGTDRDARKFTEVFDCARIQRELSQKGIDWVFNSPYNPAEGGAWERMVQCVKRVLRQTLKEIAPREYTLNSFLIEAENIVNSRPLTHLPISVDQEQPLTPNDFLLEAENTAQTPSADINLRKTCVLRQQWRIARQLRDHFWSRWINEYLPTLTRRVKWCKQTKPLEEGDLVFICDPNVARREWCRGKVERVYPGSDGVVRRADIRTSGGVKRRAASRLAVLDVEGGESG